MLIRLWLKAYHSIRLADESVVVIAKTPAEAALLFQAAILCSHSAAPRQLLRRGRAGGTQHIVLATGGSQRHAHSCAEAVRWQLLQKARTLLESQEAPAGGPQQQSQAGSLQQAAAAAAAGQAAAAGGVQQPAAAAAAPAAAAGLAPSLLHVSGAASSDWVALEAGPVTVHVFTDRARSYYDLEGLWGARGRVWAVRGGAAEGAMTKDTIR